MSELKSLKKLERIKAIDIKEKFTANYIFNNLRNFKQSDKPDIILQNVLITQQSIGIEHTEVSLFKEGKKGAEIRKSQKDLNSEQIKVELEYFEISCIDIQPHYKKKLKLDNGKTFVKNITNSIISKSKKSKSYKLFDLNILWIETEDFLEFHSTLLLNNKIKNALILSPFDSILIGNSNLTYYISKNLLKIINLPANENLVINTNKTFDQSYKVRETIQTTITATSNKTNISSNITENYTSYVKFMFEESTSLLPVSRLFANNIELNIIKCERSTTGNRIVTASTKNVILKFDISSSGISLNHTFKANKGDKFNLSLASKRSSLLQQCLTGVINIIIQEDNIIEHYKYIPSQEDINKWKIRAIEKI